MLHLLQDVLGRDDQDAFTTATSHQLRQDHADLQRLAQPDSVGEQDTRADVLRVERLGDRRPLVSQGIGEHVGRDGQVLVPVRNWRLSDQCLQPQSGVAVARRAVGDHFRFLRILHLDLVETG